jgi:hypothetical protein
MMTLTFQVRRIPHDPRGEWASGIEDGGRFYPSTHVASPRAAQRDATAMTAALKANPMAAAPGPAPAAFFNERAPYEIA